MMHESITVTDSERSFKVVLGSGFTSPIPEKNVGAPATPWLRYFPRRLAIVISRDSGRNVAAPRGTAVRHRVSVQPASVQPRAQAGGGAFCRKKLRLCPLHVPFLSLTGLDYTSCAVGHQLGQYRGQHQARVVRQSADRHGAALRLADAGALLSCLACTCRWRMVCWSTTTRTPTAGTFWTPPSRPTWCVWRMCASDVRRARFPCIVLGAGASAHTALQHLPSHADELKRNFVDKLTSLRLRLSSHACGQTHAPAQRPASHSGLWRGLLVRLCGCAHRAAQRQPHPTPAPCRAHISAPQVPHGRCVS